MSSNTPCIFDGERKLIFSLSSRFCSKVTSGICSLTFLGLELPLLVRWGFLFFPPLPFRVGDFSCWRCFLRLCISLRRFAINVICSCIRPISSSSDELSSSRAGLELNPRLPAGFSGGSSGFSSHFLSNTFSSCFAIPDTGLSGPLYL